MHGRICLQIYALRDHLVQEMEHELVGPNTCCIVCKTAHGAFDTRGLRIKWLDMSFICFNQELILANSASSVPTKRACSVGPHPFKINDSYPHLSFAK